MRKTVLEVYRGWEVVSVTPDRGPGSFGADNPALPRTSSGQPHVPGLQSVAAVRAKIDAVFARPAR